MPFGGISFLLLTHVVQKFRSQTSNPRDDTVTWALKNNKKHQNDFYKWFFASKTASKPPSQASFHFDANKSLISKNCEPEQPKNTVDPNM